MSFHDQIASANASILESRASLKRSQSYLDYIAQLEKSVESLNDRISMAAAQLGASYGALEKLAPGHPLFRLTDTIRAKGLEFGRAENDTGVIYEYGKNYPIPDYNNGLIAEINELKAKVLELERENDELDTENEDLHGKLDVVSKECLRLRDELEKSNKNVATVVDAIKALQRDTTHHVALHYAFREELTRVSPDNELVVSQVLRQELAEVSFEAFKSTKSWEKVREIGQAFLSGKREGTFSDGAAPAGHSPATDTELWGSRITALERELAAARLELQAAQARQAQYPRSGWESVHDALG